jgi:tripartite-type tricarboxylate transporter receptor subunit TctC
LKKLAATLLVLMAATVQGIAVAEEFPTRSIKYVLPFQGIPDSLARTYNDRVSAILKQPVVHDFKPGAAGRISLSEIARAKPDGYTIGMASTAPFMIHPLVVKKLPYDAEKSFAVINVLGVSAMALAVSKNSGIKTLEDLRNLSKKRELNIATGGVAGPHHLAAILLQQAGFRATLIHYKTSAEVLTVMMNGQIDAFFSTIEQQSVFEKQGFYQTIGVTSPKRSSHLPDTPTFTELGLPEIDTHTFYATVAPAATPRAVLDRLAAAYAQAAESPEVKALFQKAALQSVNMPRAELEAMIRKERVKWKQFVEKHSITVGEQ